MVTGAGLVGTAFARFAKERGEHIVFFDPVPREDYVSFKLGGEGYTIVQADVRSLPDIVDVINRHKIETIIHTAGMIGGRAQREISTAFDINVGGTRNIAEAVRLTGVKRLVHISTMGVYDARREYTEPVKEDFHRGTGKAYGNYKVAKELILEAYANEFKFELLMIRLANVYGLGHFWAGSSGGIKMQALLEAGVDGTRARIPTNETMDNEYIYATDVGRALEIAATIAMPKERIFNVGNGVVTSFQEVLDAVQSVCPKLDYEVVAGESPKSKPYPMDISRAKSLLGWQPTLSLAEGFKDFHAELLAARARNR
jgi:UDP-glucose 4-epimerase